MSLANRTQSANDDLRNIALQIGIASGRPLLADQIIDELVHCCDRLATLAPTSRLGTSAERLGAGVRLFSHRRWVVIFRYVDGGALILRIADGSQDYISWKLE